MVGRRVEMLVSGFPGPFTAKVVRDCRDRVFVKGEGDDRIRRIIKNHIISFVPIDGEPEGDDESLLVLACQNHGIGCDGVKFVKRGPGFAMSDMELFMGGCPMRCETCRCGSLGDLKSISNDRLTTMLGGLLLGEYPKEEGNG
jgi:hypothetical protein